MRWSAGQRACCTLASLVLIALISFTLPVPSGAAAVHNSGNFSIVLGKASTTRRRHGATPEQWQNFSNVSAAENDRQEAIRQARTATRQVPVSQRRHVAFNPEDEADQLADGELLDFGSNFSEAFQMAGPSSGAALGAAQQSHTATVLAREQKWRQLNDFAIDAAVMCAPELAAQHSEELQALARVVQDRISSYIAEPKHSCSAALPFAAIVEVVSWRAVELVTTLGATFIQVPTLRCKRCSVFEMPAAAACCTPSTPSQPVVWYHSSILGLASELYSPPAGVSVANFTASFNRYVEKGECLRLRPTTQPELDVKTLGTAMRHYKYQQREICNPAQLGKPITSN